MRALIVSIIIAAMCAFIVVAGGHREMRTTPVAAQRQFPG